MSRMYLAHHQLESELIIIVITIITVGVAIHLHDT